MSKTLEEAFRELIMRTRWYDQSLSSPIQAKNDKAKFLKGERLSEEQMRDYLSAAGWICIQEEEWNTPAITINEAFRELIKEEKWFEHSSYPPLQAHKDKAKFLSGKRVVEGHIREYLLSAGYKINQEEEWNTPGTTMNEAFRELIKERKWYRYSSRSSFQAQKDKSKFLSGKKVEEEHIRAYLLSAGYKMIQIEKWTSSVATMSKAFRKLIKARKWYIHSSRSPSQAQNDKAKFLSSKRVIEDHIREYLLSAGYKIILEEKWVKL